MAQIPPIDDAYINEIIKSNGPYNPALLKTQGVKMRELIKLLRDRMEQGDTGVVHTTGDESIFGTKTFTLIKAEGLSVNNLANPSLNTVISPLTGLQTKLLNLSEGTFGVQLSASVLAASRSQLLQDRDGVIALTSDLSDFPTLSQFNTELNKKINNDERGVPGGVSTLDGGGKIPASQLPDSISGALTYQGTWNATTNSPALANPPASSTKGYYYVTNTAGTQFGSTFAVGDWIVSNGTAWEKIDNSDAVTTVFGRLGNIVANEGDYSAFYPLLRDKQNSLITDGTGVKYPTVDAVTAALATGQTIGANITGNAASATRLAIARTINGIAFDGTADITIPVGPLESIDEGNGVGIVISGRNPANYGNVGLRAVDLSFSNSAFPANKGATGDYSVAFGSGSAANGTHSAAFGSGIAIGDHSAAFGQLAISSGLYSASFGRLTEANGANSAAFGENTEANGDFSYAFGKDAEANGAYSTVFGNFTTANAYSSLALGRYNDPIVTTPETSWTSGSPLLIAGNGTSAAAKNNAWVLYNNGNSVQQGSHTASSFIGDLTANSATVANAPTNPTDVVRLTDLIAYQGALTLTTAGTSGAATLIDGVLNIPQYSGGGSGWFLTGNAGTVDGTNFIGTTDDVSLNFRVNNVNAGRIDAHIQNTFLGILSGNVNTSGSANTAIGSITLGANTTGNSNTVIGAQAFMQNTTGNGNIAIGASALRFNTIGHRNIAIGWFADVSSNNLNNATVIGNSAIVDASNKVQIGNVDVTDVKLGGTSAILETSQIKLTGGSPGANKVLTSDANGLATWRTPADPGASPISGRYTPTYTGITPTIIYPCHYVRVGNEVTVTGIVSLNTIASGIINFNMSLPIPTDIETLDDLAGIATCASSSVSFASVNGDTTGNDNARFTIGALTSGSSSTPTSFSFTYTVK